MELYRKIINFGDLHIDEQKKLIYDYDKNINYSQEFYDDFKACRVNAFEKINSSIIRSDEFKKLYNSDLSNKYGINIFELNGEDFYLYAHVSKIKENDLEFPFKEDNTLPTISMSLIGKDNISLYRPMSDFIILGFNNLNIENIIHIFNSDSYTSYLKGTSKFQRIYSPDKLLKESHGYNEILYKKNKFFKLEPFCIICYNEIRDIDVYFSKKQKLPIIKINTLKYTKTGFPEDMYESIYLDAQKARDIEYYNSYFKY